MSSTPDSHFYPRPPGGGRPLIPDTPMYTHAIFLSTPSGWRATTVKYENGALVNFYPRPPGGGRPDEYLPIFVKGLEFLSTPSGWRATTEIDYVLNCMQRISIHALRVEGDDTTSRNQNHERPISIHALRVEGDRVFSQRLSVLRGISIHALRVEGDLRSGFADDRGALYFYPRPPGGGRLQVIRVSPAGRVDFYPRPPGGGRRKLLWNRVKQSKFLSTPSGWRATGVSKQQLRQDIFLSTPSGWRATEDLKQVYHMVFDISIHALRVEGDRTEQNIVFCNEDLFLSTPSGWRATEAPALLRCHRHISIHALRVEGDSTGCRWLTVQFQFLSTPSGWRATWGVASSMCSTILFLSTPSGWRATSASRSQSLNSWISIHALRVEGDQMETHRKEQHMNFYPRPPGGGRPPWSRSAGAISGFLSTPSGWRATGNLNCVPSKRSDFYPRPPGGGRLRGSMRYGARSYFYPRPPGGGRP